ncbi:hypothetical protein PLICRDRAFT_41940 [Plicaturopsis crispa FD-325 SS-3]|nr:hypothetical protein PLICRDRAFT_41940 [Plicaturopsis crispa FD-325 SS-3]
MALYAQVSMQTLREHLLPSIAAIVVAALAVGVYARRRLIARRSPPDYFKLCNMPLPTPLPDFDIDKARPRPYRPFRWEYHQTMSLKKLEPDWWIELESTYRERIAQRKAIWEKHGASVLATLPGAEPACRELMEMVIQYVCVRYPTQFTFDGATGVFENRILGTRTETYSADPLVVLMENIPEDFLLTLKDEKTGLYCMRAGVGCSALGWNVGTKIGKPLHAIHEPIPDYDKMSMSMDRYFSKMPADKSIQRGSWGLEIGEPLFLQADDPHFALRETQKPDLRIEDVNLRVDWQTLRRLPHSRAIVFNFKALFTPVTQFREEPYMPRLLLKILTDAKPSMKEYKGTWHVEHKVIPALEEWAKEQEEKGWVPKDWKPRTLNEDPFTPRWEERWESSYKL